ncbi:MAG: sugar porter family MFS transporter [Planctomycetes bacterium]|nr:sugar porter family MFS transporter [Planctomycetota bacterium]
MERYETASSSPRGAGLLVLVTLVTALGGFLFGYDTAVINGAIQYLKVHFELTSAQEGLAGASAILGCIPGAMFAGFFSDRFGRRKVLFACAVLYAVSGLLSAIPRTFFEFLLARGICGLGVGASSMICPVYIAELAPAEKRGRLGSLFQMGIVVGIFLTLFINAQIRSLGDESWNSQYGWRWMLAAEIVPALFLIAFLFFVPESPRWLLQAEREDEARAILVAVGGPKHAEGEIAAVREVLKQEEGGFLELFGRGLRQPLVVAVLLMAVSQFSGINAIIYYSTKIFTTAGVGVEDAFTRSAIIGIVNVLFTVVALVLVDRAGRRPLLIIGLTVQVVALAATGWMFHTGQTGLLLLLMVLVYIAAFAMALGPIPWIVCSEIFPTRIRGRAMSLATFVIWTSCYIVAQTFPMLNDSPVIGPAKTFWIYGGFTLFGLLFVFMRLPETKGRTLEEIEASWSNPPHRKPSA